MIGNQAVQGLVVTHAAEPEGHDVHEREADLFAQRVKTTDPRSGSPIPGPSQRTTTVPTETTGAGAVPAAPPIVRDVLRSPGRPLDPATRAFMERRLRHDFGSVRLHADGRAAESARAIDAQAYTVGRDVVLGTGYHILGSPEGRELIAHELTHVLQQGFMPRAIQRKPQKQKKTRADSSTDQVHKEIKKRDPALAELITPASIRPKNPAEPPDIKGGPMSGGEEHHWKVRVLALQGLRGSQITESEKKTKKVKGGVRVTHFLDIQWALPLLPEAEFLKQTSSEDEAFTLSAAEPLYHELLHARVMMERDPHWTAPHSQAFQGFHDLSQISDSATVDKERKEVKKQIGTLVRLGDEDATLADMTEKADKYYEFLVHEKYDADTEGKAFGKSYANPFIAKQYSEVVARRLGADVKLAKFLATAAEKLFDKLDQASKAAPPAEGKNPVESGQPVKETRTPK